MTTQEQLAKTERLLFESIPSVQSCQAETNVNLHAGEKPE